MFIVATCAAATGLASAACYLYFFARDVADVVFLERGLRGQVMPTFENRFWFCLSYHTLKDGSDPPAFTALLVPPPLFPH